MHKTSFNTARGSFIGSRHSARNALCVVALFGTLALPLMPARAQSAIGSIISYQGQLSDAAGKPLANGTTSLTFKIYEAGAEKSSQTMSVATFGGVFNTFLSVGTLTFDPTKSYELGITFNGSETRHPIAAVPVALSAASATTATTAGNVSGVVPVANGGTGSTTKNFVDLTSAQTVAGAKAFGSAVTAPGFNIGANRILGASANGRSVFLGTSAGAANGRADYNVLLGAFAGAETTGTSNVFVGDRAGYYATGNSNLALGDSAGINWIAGSNNIAIKNPGLTDDSNTIRIGNTQTQAFLAGIRGATGLTNTLPVVVDANGQLGTGSGTTNAATLSGVVPIANGGTGSSTQNFVDLTAAQTIAGAKTFSDALRGNNSLLMNGTTGATPISGGGTRLMWVPAKSAFRAGYVTGAQWDDASIGTYSMALGNNATASGDYSTALGYNTRASGDYSTVMGHTNTASGSFSTAMGYKSIASGNNSMALGNFASTNGKSGSFAYGDISTSSAFGADLDNQAVWRTAGGFKIYSNSGLTAGVNLAAGSGSWSTLSDRGAKDKFGSINPREVLRRVSALPLSSWQYKGNPSRHIGPMAQDFRAAFGLGPDEKHIDTVDADGVALAAIQGLNSELKERDTKIANLETQLKAQNAAFETRLKKLESGR